MESSNQLSLRSRSRQPDLRRKVLLKNFLRDKMTHVSPVAESNSKLDSLRSDEDENTNDENISSNCIPTEVQSSTQPFEANQHGRNKVKLVNNNKQSSVLKLLKLERIRRLRTRRTSKVSLSTKKSRKNIKPESMLRISNDSKEKIINLKASSKTSGLSVFAMLKLKRIFRKSPLKSNNILQNRRSFTHVVKKASSTLVDQSSQTDLSWSMQEDRMVNRDQNSQEKEPFYKSNLNLSGVHQEKLSQKLTLQRSLKSPYDSYNSKLISTKSLIDCTNPHSTAVRQYSFQGKSLRRSGRLCHRTKSVNEHMSQKYFERKSYFKSDRNETNINNKAMVLKSLHMGINSPRPIVRRSSMPGKSQSGTERPVLRQWSMSVKNPGHRDYVVNRNFPEPSCKWLVKHPNVDSENGTESRSPFLSLPNEAFY